MDMRLLSLAAMIGVLTVAACNKGGSTDSGDPAASAGLANTAAETAVAPAADTAAPVAAEAAEPDSIALADGTPLPVIKASVLDSDYQAHVGLVAIAGEVAAVYADKGTFMLKDCPEDESCKTEDNCACCSEAQIPVRVAASVFDGALPAVAQEVIVIAEVSATAAGYNLDVREVRQGDQAILTRKPDAA